MLRPFLFYLAVAFFLLALAGAMVPWHPVLTVACWLVAVGCAIPVVVRPVPLTKYPTRDSR